MKIKGILSLIILLGVVLSISLVSCEKDENKDPVFILSPKDPVTESAIGEKTIFNIEIEGNDATLDKFTITQQDQINGLQLLFEETINKKYYSYLFEYETPIFEDSTLISLVFKITTDKSADLSLTRRIMVLGDNTLLNESTGHTLFSALSGNYSGFNIDLLQPLSVNDNPDSLIHFADHSVDSIHFNTLSREWISPAGLHFVQFDGFSYPEATFTMMQNAYTYGIKLTSVDELENDDILIIGKDEDAFAVIQIVQIIDSDSTLNDKYLFNLKK